MAGRKFLTPLIRAILCTFGMAVMGYFLYGSIADGTLHDRITLVRALVFVGFGYLLVQSAKDLIRQKGGNG
jgi:hypothetical protein